MGIRLKLHREYVLVEPGIRGCKPPGRVVIPICGVGRELCSRPGREHSSLPTFPLVSISERVLRGQKIAEDALPIHATVSGTVTAIEPRPHPEKGIALAIEIRSDGRDEPVEGLGQERPDSEIASLGVEDLRQIAREAGIFDLAPNKAPARTVIVSAAEDEPYLAANYLLMLAKPVEILRGVEFLMRACAAREAVIAISEGEREGYEILASKLFTLRIPKIRLVWLKDTYPQGLDLGPPLFDLSGTFAFYEAVKLGKPFLEQVVTVAGACLIEPGNVWARIGTAFQDLIDQCGGFLRYPASVIAGGPMTGKAQDTLEVPVIRSTTGILTFPKEELSLDAAEPCIRCGECISACPVGLNPAAIVEAVGDHSPSPSPEACIACGNCSYVCPSKIPVMDLVCEAKPK